MNHRKSPPWEEWSKLSDKGHARDTIFSDCGHSFFQIPYTIEFLIQSRITLTDISCSSSACKAVDEYWSEVDTNYISKINPPSVRAVNKLSALVMSQDGIIQGPYTFKEWKLYAWQCWDWFHDIVEGRSTFDWSNKSTWWAKVYFRDMSQFVAGNYNYYSDIHLLMIRKIIDEDSQHSCYASMHSGVDLFHNLKPMDIWEAKPFHNKGKVFNISMPYVTNIHIRGVKSQEVNIVDQRRLRREFFEKLKNKKNTNSVALNRVYEGGDVERFENWYPLVKQIPFKVVDNHKDSLTVLPAFFENNEKHTNDHQDKIIKCLTGFLTTGALRMMPKNYTPVMTAALVLANAEHPTKKVRPCFDGGPLKITAAFKYPCKLEGLPQIFTLLATRDKVTKMDDTQGFHLVSLHPESRDLCVFEFKGRHFQYVALPFGQSEAPGAFQQANQIPLLYASEFGISVTCYLDDRLIAEPEGLKIDGVKIDPNLGRSCFLIVLVILSSGGFINMLKSNFEPVFKDEFLGMDIDTTTCTVSVPERKIRDLKESIQKYDNLDEIELTELEKIRGVQASFLIASKYLKMFIRVQTILIEQCKTRHPGEIHHFYKHDKIPITSELRAEWKEWTNASIIELSRCWLPPIEQGTPEFFLHTDASLAAWGAVLFEGMEQVGVIALPFDEDQSEWTIVQKEILAIFFAIVHFAEKLRNSTIQLYCDNQQAVYAFINDGSREPRVNEILIDIYRILKILNAELKIAWIPTHLQIGDEPSRTIDLNEEFLPKLYYNAIVDVLPFEPEIDAMASFTNKKCSQFITRGNLKIPMLEHLSNDFFTVTQETLGFKNLYVFPPKVILDRTCRHLARFFQNTNYVLIFHQFFELPIGIETLLSQEKTEIFTLSRKKALTFIPSEKDATISDANGNVSTFKGSPNIRPKAIRMLVHLKNSDIVGEEDMEF